MTEQYQIVQLQSGTWNIYNNWKAEWIKADFNSKGAALAYLQSRHPKAVFTVKEAR